MFCRNRTVSNIVSIFAYSTNSVVEIQIPLQPIILTLSALPSTSQIHTPKPPNSFIVFFERKILGFMYLDLLVDVHAAVFSMSIDQSGNSHCMFHTLLYGRGVGRVEDEVQTVVWMAVKRECGMCCGNVRRHISRLNRDCLRTERQDEIEVQGLVVLANFRCGLTIETYDLHQHSLIFELS